MKNKLNELGEEINRLERMAKALRDIGLINKARNYESLVKNLRLRFGKLELQCFEGEDLTLYE